MDLPQELLGFIFSVTAHLNVGCHRLCHSRHSESDSGLKLFIGVIRVLSIHTSLAIANFIVLNSYELEDAICQVLR